MNGNIDRIAAEEKHFVYWEVIANFSDLEGLIRMLDIPTLVLNMTGKVDNVANVKSMLRILRRQHNFFNLWIS